MKRQSLSVKSRSRSRTGSMRPIPRLQKGELKQFGYSLDLPSDERRVALQRAIKTYPVLSVMRKLNALYVLQKNRYPVNANKFKADEKWLKSNFFVSKSVDNLKKKSKPHAMQKLKTLSKKKKSKSVKPRRSSMRFVTKM